MQEQRLSNQSSRLTRELRQLQRDHQAAESKTPTVIEPIPENEANSEPNPIPQPPVPAEKEAETTNVDDSESIG